MRKYCVIIEAEDGPDFQEYVYGDGSYVPAGEPVGVEVYKDGGVELILLEDVYFADEPKQY